MENILSTKLEIALTNGTKGHGKQLYKQPYNQYIVPKKGSLHFKLKKTYIILTYSYFIQCMYMIEE